MVRRGLTTAWKYSFSCSVGEEFRLSLVVPVDGLQRVVWSHNALSWSWRSLINSCLIVCSSSLNDLTDSDLGE